MLRLARRTLGVLLWSLLALLGLIAMAAVALVLRLLAAPIDLAFLKPEIVRAASQAVPEAAVRLDRVVLAWVGGHPRVLLEKVQLGPRTPSSTLPQIAVGRVRLDADLRGSIAAEGLRLRAVQAEGMTVRLPPAAPSAATALTPLDLDQALSPALAGLAGAFGPGTSAPRSLRVTGLTLERPNPDDRPSLRVTAPELTLEVDGDRGGLRLESAGQIAWQAPDAAPLLLPFELEARGRFAPASLDLALAVDRLALTALGPYAPVFAGWPAEATIRATLAWPQDPLLRLDLGIGPGTLTWPQTLRQPLSIDSLKAQAALDPKALALLPQATRLTLSNGVRLDVRPNLTLPLDGSEPHGTVQVESPGFDRDVLLQLWPVTFSIGGHRWVNERLPAAALVDLKAEIGFTPGQKPAVNGTFGIRDARMIVIPGLDEIVDGFATAALTPDEMNFVLERARSNDVQLTGGKVRLYGLRGDDHRLQLAIDLDGPLSSALALVNKPPLEYAKKLDLDPARVKGHARGTLKMAFPLLADLKLDTLELNLDAVLTNVQVPEVIASRDASSPRLEMKLDRTGMVVTGPTGVGGFTGEAVWTEDFDDSRPFDSQIRFKASGPSTALRNFDIDPGERMTGQLGLDGLFEVRQKRGRLDVKLDLTQATLELPEFGWLKAPGTAASGSVQVQTIAGRVEPAIGFSLAAPGLAGIGAIRMHPGDRALQQLRLDWLRTAGSHVTILAAPQSDGSWAVQVKGPRLDLARAIEQLEKGERLLAARTRDQIGPRRPPVPLDLGLSVRQLRLASGFELGDVTATARRDPGGAWVRGALDARQGPARLWMRLDRAAPGQVAQPLQFGTDDAGRLLDGLGAQHMVEGGVLAFEGRRLPSEQDVLGLIEGQVRITRGRLRDAPLIVRLVNALSIPGLAELLGGPGMEIYGIEAELLREPSRILLRSLRGHGAGLGATASGIIHTEGLTRLDLSGTAVPFVGVSQLLEGVPVLGEVLVGAPGEGLLGARFTANGPAADPMVAVDALSLLAPGVLRTLLFPEEPPKTTPPVP